MDYRVLKNLHISETNIGDLVNNQLKQKSQNRQVKEIRIKNSELICDNRYVKDEYKDNSVFLTQAIVFGIISVFAVYLLVHIYLHCKS